MKLIVTKQFEKAVKNLQKDHNTQALNELQDRVHKIHDQTLGALNSNHPLTNANGLKDVHIFNNKLILLYRYDVDSDTLVVSAKLHDVVNHDQLHTKGVFNERPGVDMNLEDVDKLIKGSTEIDISNRDEVEDFIYSIYNTVIARYIAVDDVMISNLQIRDDYMLVTLTGVQYKSLIPWKQFTKKATQVEHALESEGFDECNVVRYEDSSTDSSSDAYDVEFRFRIDFES